MSDKRKSNLMGVKPTLDINPLTRDFKQPESVLKKTVTPGPRMGEIGAVVGLGTAAGYAAGKKSAKDVMEKESKKPTKKFFIGRRGTSTRTLVEDGTKESPMKANPVGGKKKGMNQEERRKYFGVQKRSTGGKVKKAFMGLAVEAMKNSKGVRDVASNLGIGPRLLANYFDKKESKPSVEQKVATKSLGGEMKKGYGAARQKGMGLEDEGLGLEMGKGSDYIKDLL